MTDRKSSQPVETLVDMCSLDDPKNQMVHVLRSRFSYYNNYTDLSACSMIAINPFKKFAQNDAQTSQDYVASYKNTVDEVMTKKLNPHVFGLTNRSFFCMRRTGKDQVIILSGASGSGKTEIRHLIIQHLIRLSNTKKQSKLHQAILSSQKVIDAFGLAKTAHNESGASRYGAYTEIHFNERGRLIGAKTLYYFLEKSRVVATSNKPSEGNFNIFYWLLSGTSPDEKQVLQLKDSPKDYPYLAKYGRGLLETDQDNYKELRVLMRAADIRRDQTNRIIQLLAAILHLGTIQFTETLGVGAEEAVTINNPDTIAIVADFLGLEVEVLASVFQFKTTIIGKDVTTLILNAEQAAAQRDLLAHVLYSLLFSWLVERINQKTYTDQFNTFVGVLDFPGTQTTGFGAVGFEQFCINYANERINCFLANSIFEVDQIELQTGGIQVSEPTVINTACLDLFTRPKKGLCDVISNLTEKQVNGNTSLTGTVILDKIQKYNAQNPALSFRQSDTGARQFVVQHFAGQVNYDPHDFLSKNMDESLGDFIPLFRGTADTPASWNGFVLDLFSDENLALENQTLHTMPALLSAQQSAKPARQPSMKQSKRKTFKERQPNESSLGKKTVLSQIASSLDDLVNSFQEANIWNVFCIRPNVTSSSTQFDSALVETQIKALNLEQFAVKLKQFYIASLPHAEFLTRYQLYPSESTMSEKEQCESVKLQNNWSDYDMAIGITKVFLSYSIWSMLEEKLRALEKQEQKVQKLRDNQVDNYLSLDTRDSDGFIRTGTPLDPLPSLADFSQAQTKEYFSEDENPPVTESLFNSQYAESKFEVSEHDKQEPKSLSQETDTTEEKTSSMTSGRRRWLYFVWLVTFWMPDFCLIKCGRMKRKDVRIAWREKVTLCGFIVLACGFIIWFLVFFSDLICPSQNVYTTSELAEHNSDTDGYVAIRGEVFKLSDFAAHHYPGVVSTSAILEYVGTDVTDLFPIQVSDLCKGVSPYVSLDYSHTYSDNNSQYHDFRYNTDDYRKNWYYDQMTMLRENYKVGNMGYDSKGLKDEAEGSYTLNGESVNRNWAVIDSHIYDLTTYIMGGRYITAPSNKTAPANVSTDFLDTTLVSLFWENSGTDITSKFNNLSLTDTQKERELACLRNLYYVGLLDIRNSIKCQFTTYFLLVITVCLCAVVFFKFAAALRFGSGQTPEESEKLVICQITCYTEDEDSLRKTIDSIACLRYDDKRKLILVICDGMIIGSGNDRPTPRIVLDIFGVNPRIDPEPVSFVSVGEGMKQHNRAKLYSGLYEIRGHVVPYLVVAKVGTPQERQKPGNRGKRDSQLVLMQFLNKVHFDAPMNPMQLEMYHQMRNIIGVSPELYDYVLMVDADTEVMPMGMSHLVASMSHDTKIIGLCGETTLANEKDSWVTMIQVYEYFISHYMIKSFESLFSSVSCLPGCFTMYRIRTVDRKRPLFVSNEIIEDYSVNVVDTLHKKNLLYLGEDRYLTTLLLKHFPNFKTKFNPGAQCKTNAPDTWSVLVSQRRRWINSTVHNLGELVFLNQLCGFCCFSMRFIVMLDLFSTLIQPALLAYLGVLIWKLATATNGIPYITIITLGCTYGLQIFIFIIHKRWEYIAWFFISILALPVFSFYIPLYAYWHFDDFSWGNTRIVVGDKGKKTIVGDEDEFNPKSIPLIRWSEYEKQMMAENRSDRLSQGTYPSSVYGAPHSISGYSRYTASPVHSIIHPQSVAQDYHRMRYGPTMSSDGASETMSASMVQNYHLQNPYYRQ